MKNLLFNASFLLVLLFTLSCKKNLYFEEQIESQEAIPPIEQSTSSNSSQGERLLCEFLFDGYKLFDSIAFENFFSDSLFTLLTKDNLTFSELDTVDMYSQLALELMFNANHDFESAFNAVLNKLEKNELYLDDFSLYSCGEVEFRACLVCNPRACTASTMLRTAGEIPSPIIRPSLILLGWIGQRVHCDN